MDARSRCGQQGLTLVEVLVAVLIMAVLASMAWQGLDGIVRAREGNSASIDQTLRLNAVLTQWEQDLMAVRDVGVVPAINFDGQTLRLTRSAEGGVSLVAWSVRGGVWQRWAGPTHNRVRELQEAWLNSHQLLGGEAGHVTLADASDWQIHFYRGNAWTNAQSTGDVALAPAGASSGAVGAAAKEQLPRAVRLIINLSAGTLTRDIVLGPQGQ